MTSFDSENGPSTTVGVPSSNTTRAPTADGSSPPASSRTPAAAVSAMSWPMACCISADGSVWVSA